jgi:DNA polymerase III sliding clamp (beta) subunit (PCNA family)
MKKVVKKNKKNEAVEEKVEKKISKKAKSKKADANKKSLIKSSKVSKSEKTVKGGDISFKVGRIAMNNAIDIVSMGLPSKDYGDASSGILMEIKKEDPNELILCTNSLSVFVRTKLKLDAPGDPGVVVPNGNIVTGVVSSLRAMKHPISIAYSSKESKLNLACGKEYDGAVAHYDPIGFNLPMNNDEIKKFAPMSIPVRLIKRAINEVVFTCSKDKTNIAITGIYFGQDKNGMDIVGSDSLRISAIRYRGKVQNPQSVVFDTANLEMMRKLLTALQVDDNEIIKLYTSDDMAYFIVGDTTVGFQTYGRDYFDEYKQFMKKKEDCEVTFNVNREQFLMLLELATSHNESNSDSIMMNISEGEGRFVNKVVEGSTNVNEFEIPFAVKNVVCEDDASVAVNPQFLIDVLTKLKEKEVTIGLVDAESGPGTVYPVGDEVDGKYIHVFTLTE